MRLSNSFGFALFLLLLREKHGVVLLICLFLLITKVFIKFKRMLFGKHIRLCSFKMYKLFQTYKTFDVHIFQMVSCYTESNKAVLVAKGLVVNSSQLIVT